MRPVVCPWNLSVGYLGQVGVCNGVLYELEVLLKSRQLTEELQAFTLTD